MGFSSWLQDAKPKEIGWAVGGSALILVLIVGAVTDAEDDVDDPPVAATPEPEPTEEPKPSPSAVATEMESEVAVTEEPEEIVESEEEYELTEEDIRTAVFPIVFDSTRDGVIEVLQDMFVVESVDQYVYDKESGTVLVSLTPAFDYDEGVRDDAWEVTRAFAVLYDDEAWLEPSRTFVPTLEVDISTAHYRCDGETMVALAEARLARTDWDSACRVS